MKSSAVQQAFKSLTSRIHPQLPLSERESTRLLNALTSSFRHQLDHHHHQEPKPTALHASSSPSPSPSPSTSSTATERHLASILTNPLLGKPTISSTTVSQLRTKHPITLFEDQVATGHATLDSARLCLQAFRRSLDKLSPAEFNNQVRQYAAGSRALRWLWSSASTQTLSFTQDHRFLDEMSHFLIIEGRESALWELLETPISTVNLPAKESRRRKGFLLCSIVKTHLSSSADPVSSALNSFFRAMESSVSSQIHLTPAGACLVKDLVKLESLKTSQLVLYDRFVGSCSLWDTKSKDRAFYRAANLTLHHPLTPSAEGALSFIRHLKSLPSHPFLSPSNRIQKNHVFTFFFDTVKLLQKQGHLDDAVWVMEFMQQNFPNDFAQSDRLVSKAASPTSQFTESTDTSPESILPDWRAPEMG